MLKRFLAIIALTLATNGFAADVNKSTAVELTQVNGIGPAIADRIIAERKKGGDFKNWPDLIARVKGIGKTSAENFSNAGLTVNGQTIKGAAANNVKAPAQNAKVSATANQKPAAPQANTATKK